MENQLNNYDYRTMSLPRNTHTVAWGMIRFHVEEPEAVYLDLRRRDRCRLRDRGENHLLAPVCHSKFARFRRSEHHEPCMRPHVK